MEAAEVFYGQSTHCTGRERRNDYERLVSHCHRRGGVRLFARYSYQCDRRGAGWWNAWAVTTASPTPVSTGLSLRSIALYLVNVTEQMVDAEPQEIITNDNLNALVDAQIYLQDQGRQPERQGSAVQRQQRHLPDRQSGAHDACATSSVP